MFETSRPHSCASHPSRRAKAACVLCGRYLCEECLEVVEDGAACGPCAGKQQAGGGKDKPSPAQAASRKEAAGPEARAGRGVCSFHPSERAVAFCSHCGAPLCQDCRMDDGDQAFCTDCFSFISREGAPAAPAARRGPGSPGAGTYRSPSRGARWKLWPGLAFLPVPFLLELTMTYMINQGGEVSLGMAVLFISAILYSTLLVFAAWQVGEEAGWLKELGVTSRNLKESLSWGLLGGLASFGFTALLLSLSVKLLGNWGWIENWLKGLMEINVKAGVSRVDLAIAFVVVVLLGPFCEEAFFRGYLYPPMRGKIGTAAAIMLNAALFSLVHFSLFGLLSRMAAGCIFCALYEHTDNLAAPVSAHMLSNFIAFILPVVSM